MGLDGLSIQVVVDELIIKLDSDIRRLLSEPFLPFAIFVVTELNGEERPLRALREILISIDAIHICNRPVQPWTARRVAGPKAGTGRS